MTSLHIEKMQGCYINVPQGLDMRSFAAGMVSGMAPFQWDGVKASHVERVGLEKPDEAIDVVVCPSKPDDVDDFKAWTSEHERRFTFEEFESWIWKP